MGNTITADEVKGVRATLKMSRKDFAAAVGASRSSVDYWERGIITPGAQFTKKIRGLVKKPASSTKQDTAATPATPAAVEQTAPDTQPDAVKSHSHALRVVIEHADIFRKRLRRRLIADAVQYVTSESKGKLKYENSWETITTFLMIVRDNDNSLTVQDILDGLARSS